MRYIYITDGSLEGLLCAIHEMYYSGNEAQDILHCQPMQLDFSVPYKSIETDIEKAHKVYEAINQKISVRAAEEITLTWLSELPFCGKHIANYLRLGFKRGYQVDYMLSHADVLPVHKAASKVRMETHRMLGLCRFSKTEQDYYVCEISPDHNILSLLAPHFSTRMSDMNWIIHDKSRKLSAVYDTKDWFIAHSQLPSKILYSKQEFDFRKIWQTYFDTIAIEGRNNPKLQRKFVPIRYRENITEFKFAQSKL